MDELLVPEIGVHAPDRFHLGTRAALRVLVQAAGNSRRAEPVAAARVAVSLEPRDGRRVRLGDAPTGPDGAADLAFVLPDLPPGPALLVVRAETPHGETEVRREIVLRSDGCVALLVHPSPVHPGEAVRLEAVVLHALSRIPIAGAPVEFAVFDPRGDLLVMHRAVTGPLGVAGVDHRLPAVVRAGRYAVRATSGDLAGAAVLHVADGPAETVRVEAHPDRAEYLVTDTVRLKVHAEESAGGVEPPRPIREVAALAGDTAFESPGSESQGGCECAIVSAFGSRKTASRPES